MKMSRPPEAFEEFLLNSLGYRLLRADRIEDAIAAWRHPLRQRSRHPVEQFLQVFRI